MRAVIHDDPELIALKKLTALLQPLDAPAQRRIVQYAYDRWCPPPRDANGRPPIGWIAADLVGGGPIAHGEQSQQQQQET